MRYIPFSIANFLNFFFLICFLLVWSPIGEKSVVALEPVPRSDTVIFDAYGRVANPFVFNWMVPGVTRSNGMHQSVWEPLFILNYETNQIEPWLGLSFVPNSDLNVWTLKIRKGIEWSDGQAYNADDIVFTINLLLKDQTQTLNEAANIQQWVKKVEKVDSLTVKFTLKRPNPRFQLDYFSVRVWGNVVILPQHVWENKDPFTFTNFDLNQDWPLGTGPYRLVKANENEFIYDRRDDWWGVSTGFSDLPQPKRLVWIVTGVEENRSLLAANSELDSVGGITLGAFEAISAMNPNMIAWKKKMPFVWLDPCPRQISLNHTVPPWDQAEMRHAISLIIDRRQIVEIAYEGTSFPSKSIFVAYPGMKPFLDAIPHLWIPETSDISSAQKIIEANGWKLSKDKKPFYKKEMNDGSVSTLSLNLQTEAAGIELRRVADVVVEQLRSAGILATNRAVEGATWNDNKAYGKFEGVVDWDACGSVNEPWLSMNRYTSQFHRPIGARSPGNNNFVRWKGKKADQYSKLVSEIGVLPLGSTNIEPLFIEAMQLFQEEQVVIPLNQAIMLIPFDTTYWIGWPSEKNNYIHPPMWWMSAHRVIHNLKKVKR